MARVKRGRPQNAIPNPYPKKIGETQVYYYCVRDEHNKRVTISTGCTKKSDAIKLIRAKIINDDLMPPDRILFSEYAADFFDWEKSVYIKSRNSSDKPITKEYADEMRKILERRILPYFEKTAIDEITFQKVNKWSTTMRESGGENKKPLAPTTVKHAWQCFSMIMSYAHTNEIISRNPFDKAAKISSDFNARGILTLTEAREIVQRPLFESSAYYLANKIAWLTGMRIGEIVALEAEDIGEDRIFVTKARRRLSGVTEGTKGSKKRNIKTREIPLLPEVCKELKELSDSGLLFRSPTGAIEDPKKLSESFNRAIGARNGNPSNSDRMIDRSKRNIDFHSWRHFYNTRLASANVSNLKIKYLMGHNVSSDMTQRYLHFGPNDMREVYAVQQSIMENDPEDAPGV